MRDLYVQRLRLADPRAALAFAGLSVGRRMAGATTLIEARGKQVVILCGAALEDPRRAARLRAAAWDVLPVRGERSLLHVARAGAKARRTAKRGPAYELDHALYAALHRLPPSTPGERRTPHAAFDEAGEARATLAPGKVMLLTPGEDDLRCASAQGEDAEVRVRAIAEYLETLEAASERLAAGDRPARDAAGQRAYGPAGGRQASPR